MLGDILSAISLGRRLITTIADLRRDIHSVRSGNVRTETRPGRLEALEARLGNVETEARDQHARIIALEQSLSDTLRATEALAERVNAIFWIASVACGLALIALIASVVALARILR